MTNSIASAKCSSSSLFSGNYGMTQNYFADESKEYIFVKLTDSAFRAIEEYQRNESARFFKNSNQGPKIQFSGNSGVIEFPTPESKGGEGRKFGFSIDDVEGSLECIQQTSQNHKLDVLGSLSYRMRIHANEDVYDTTRTKMAIAEETEKSKCIREIKPNQTDIGRKVKKAPHSSSASSTYLNHIHHSGSINSNNSNSNNTSTSNFLNNRSKIVSPSHISMDGNGGNVGGGSNAKFGSATTISSRSPNPLLNTGGNTITNKQRSNNQNSSYGLLSNNNNNNNHSNNNNNNLSSPNSAASLSMTLASGFVNGYTSTGSPNQDSSFLGRNKSGANNTNIATNVMNSGLKSARGIGSSNNGKVTDISRRKIRERLIHMLALRPFKKPELYARLQNEGLKERERQVISNILKDISTLSRDNTYNLKRQMWNDVNENWPYYTEQEIQQLKRRKPQNLTPPLSSDAGSSTSGQSPTSTHTGSPPPLASSNSHSIGNDNLKRTSLDSDRIEENFLSGVQTKKQRISHYKKDNIPYSTSNVNVNRSGYNSGSNNNSNQQQQYNASSTSSSFAPSSKSTLSTLNSPNSIIRTVDEHFGNTDLSYNILENMDDIMPHFDRNTHYGSNSSSSNNNNNISNNNPSSSCNQLDNEMMTTGGGSNGGNYISSICKNPYSNSNSNVDSKNRETGNVVPAVPGKSQISTKSLASHNDFQAVDFNPIENIKSSQAHFRHTAAAAAATTTTTAAAANSAKSRQKASNTSSYKNKPFPHANAVDSVANGRDHERDNKPQQKHTDCLPNKVPRSSTPQNRNHQHQKKQSKISQELKPPSKSSTIVTSNESLSALCATRDLDQAAKSSSAAMRSSRVKHNPSPIPQHLDGNFSPNVELTNTGISRPNQSRYDFSNYTPITTIEQRRHYKTEFENDYDEYRKLLTQIEDVSKRFQELALRLDNVSPGCVDYEIIKGQILYEYNRIRNEEALRRDKQRFDYLHEKLAYIKQLVTDYDKTLTGATQQHKQQQHHQTQSPTNSMDLGSGKAAAAMNARLAKTLMHDDNDNNVNTFKQEQTYEHQQLQQQQRQNISSFMNYQNHNNNNNGSSSNQSFCKRNPDNMKSSPQQLQFHESNLINMHTTNPNAAVSHPMSMDVGNYNIDPNYHRTQSDRDDDDDDDDDEDDEDDDDENEQESDDSSSKSDSHKSDDDDDDDDDEEDDDRIDGRANDVDDNLSASNNSDESVDGYRIY